MREDFILPKWKEAWFLLLPKIDDNHVVIDGIVNNLVALSCDGNVTSWQRMEINDEWWCSKGASALIDSCPLT